MAIQGASACPSTRVNHPSCRADRLKTLAILHPADPTPSARFTMDLLVVPASAAISSCPTRSVAASSDRTHATPILVVSALYVTQDANRPVTALPTLSETRTGAAPSRCVLCASLALADRMLTATSPETKSSASAVKALREIHTASA
jgi:hypothetical protein